MGNMAGSHPKMVEKDDDLKLPADNNMDRNISDMEEVKKGSSTKKRKGSSPK